MSMLIRAIAIAHMMPMVHMLVEGLRDSQGHRFHDAEQPIQDPGFEKRIMDQVVGNSVDIPRHAHGINETHANQNPPGGIREHEEKREHVSEMEEPAKNTNRIPFGILQNFHFSFLLF